MRCSQLKLALALCSAVYSCTALASTVTAPEPRWDVVPDQQLNQYRGGVDLGPLVASFTIQRTIEVDGVVVARMEIVISNLDNLGNGGAPTVSVSGPAAALVQIMDKSGVAAAASAAQSLQTNGPAGVTSNTSPALASSQTGSGLTTNGQGTPGTVSASAGGNGGSVQSGGQQTGSSAQLGNAINTAVSAANGGALAGSSGSSGSASGGSASPSTTAITANIPTSTASTATSVVPPGTPIIVLPTATAASSPSSSVASSKTVALGNTGQVAVVSTLPNAAAMTTAIQNEVKGATIQAQTTITATLNSLNSLGSLSLASQITKQVAGATAGM